MLTELFFASFSQAQDQQRVLQLSALYCTFICTNKDELGSPSQLPCAHMTANYLPVTV